MSRVSDWERETLGMLEAEGLISANLIPRGKHLKIEARTATGRSICAFIAKTPSDWRAQRNNRAKIRRMIREATA